MLKISFYTLGCKSNQYETDRMVEQVRASGYDIVPYPQAADIYVINTCTVTSNAAKKSRNAIRHSKRINPKAKVIFTGCDAEIESVHEADVILLNKNKMNIVNILPPIPSPFHGEGCRAKARRGEVAPARVRANLMIEDGCQNFCSYCIVPLVRGKVRSRPMDEVLCEAAKMVDSGVKEIVLTGINLGEFPKLSNLISGLSKIKGLIRIRLSSIEPQYVDDALIEVIKTSPKVCHHLHIPLQSGDDGILKAMNRTYTSKEYSDLIDKIKKQIKDIAITTDIIAGFPGESEKAFRSTVKLAEKIGFSRIHVFSYSDRPGTKASGFPDKVDPKTIAGRRARLEKLRGRHMLRFHRSFKGRPMEVLIESHDKRTGRFEGLTGNYIRVLFPGTTEVGKLAKVKFKRFENDIVTAEIA